MTKQILFQLKNNFILNPFFIILFLLIVFFNFIFPIIVFDFLNFDAVYLFDFQTLSLFYLISYCWLGVLWAFGTIYYFILSTYKFGYVHGLLELKYHKKQILLILFSLVLISSLFYIFQVSLQTLILGLVYQNQGFKPLYALGALFYSFLILAIIYSSVMMLKLLFNLSNFVISIIIISFTAVMPIISTILLTQTKAITIESFREAQHDLIHDGDKRDLVLANENEMEFFETFKKNIYQNLIYLDLSNQAKSVLDIFGQQNEYKKIDIKKLKKEEEFNYFQKNGSYGVVADFENITNYKYLVDQEFLLAFNQENLLSKSFLSNDQIELIYSIFSDLVNTEMPLELYYQTNKYTMNWNEILKTQTWVYRNVLNFIIFNFSNEIFDFKKDFIKAKKIILEINEEGYKNLMNQSEPEDFVNTQNFERYTLRIDILDQDLDFNYLKKDYLYQMDSIKAQYSFDLSFKNQIWNFLFDLHIDEDIPTDNNYLNFQTTSIQNQYFKYLNALYFVQKNILQKEIVTINDLDKLTEHNNLFIKEIESNKSAISGIKEYNFDDYFLVITYENLYSFYPFIIFWFLLASLLTTTSFILIRKRNLL